MRQAPHGSVRVAEITDAEADVLRAANPALSALLSNTHPARAMARNLFHLSRMIDLAAAGGQSPPALVNEIDLANAWWRYGGGRSEDGKFERLKLLRGLGERVIARPGLALFRADELDSKTVEELLRVESLREDRPGATVAFWHDTLRDWAVGFLLDEQPEFVKALPLDQPLPGALSRGIEIAARLALEGDQTGARWVSLLASFEGEGCHGSWRRPILLALPRSENAFNLFDRVEAALIAQKGQRLKEIIRLMIAVESEPFAKIVAQLLPSTPGINAFPANMVIPKGATWMPLVIWALARMDRLPSAVIPELAKLFQLWLIATQAHAAEINALILQKLYDWLTRIEDAKRPVTMRDLREAMKKVDLDFSQMNEVHEEIRMTFLAFCHLKPELAEQYLAGTDPDRHSEARDILRFPGSALKAAPTAFVDFALAVLIPKEDEDALYRNRHDRFGPFGVYDTDFVPTSPGQGPFFALLESSPSEGLRLVRALTEHATQWHREEYSAERRAFPVMTIPFPDGPKSYEGGLGIYQWARGGTGALVATSALMALEAWAHRQIDQERPFGEILHAVLGPSGSSVAFVCVAVDLVLSHWSVAENLAWPMLATPKLLVFDHVRHLQDTSGMGRFFLPEQEPANWPVKTAELLAKPSRRRELENLGGHYVLNGAADINAKLREALERANEHIAKVTYPDDKDLMFGLRATAKRALRMTDARHWIPKTVRLADGREVEAHEYQLTPEEIAFMEAGRTSSTANITETSIRLHLQKALLEPQTSTAEIVAQGIAWANAAVGAVIQPTDADENDNFDNQWRSRAIVMAAALAARDYEGADRADVEAWSQPILQKAATEQNDDMASRGSDQIYSNDAAIAAVGYSGLYRRNQNVPARDRLLVLATRPDHAVLHALGNHLTEFDRLDPRFPRSITRIVLKSVVHSLRTHEAEEDKANLDSYRQAVAEAIEAEKRWLDGSGSEPAWPELAPWHSRRRRGFRIGRYEIDDEPESAVTTPPEVYVDEQALGIIAGHLIRLTLGDVREWVVSLAHHLMGWTIDANNGPPGDNEHERENRPYHWNSSYFDFLGILCVALPFERGRALFMQPMTQLHDEAFHDAMASFLRGFDRATLATDTRQPDNPVAVRAVFAERLRHGRMAERLNDRVSFTAETHLADALNAMFYQPSRWANRGRPDIPERWAGLPECMPILTPIVTSAPMSGYLVVVFLTLVESFPGAALLPYVVQVASSWCKAHGVGSSFWSEHQIGHRICGWIERTLSEDAEALAALDQLRDEIGKCLDVLVRSGVPSARTLEARSTNDGPLTKSA
jgi:hypothetical protein